MNCNPPRALSPPEQANSGKGGILRSRLTALGGGVILALALAASVPTQTAAREYVASKGAAVLTDYGAAGCSVPVITLTSPGCTLLQLRPIGRCTALA